MSILYKAFSILNLRPLFNSILKFTICTTLITLPFSSFISQIDCDTNVMHKIKTLYKTSALYLLCKTSLKATYSSIEQFSSSKGVVYVSKAVSSGGAKSSSLSSSDSSSYKTKHIFLVKTYRFVVITI